MDDDLEKLQAIATDLVFLPETAIIYPGGEQQIAFVEVPSLSRIIEGESRPGFFKGVATVVLKLFNMVQPDYAVFGEKDFQQLLVIRQLVKDLHLPVEIIAGPIKRETDGLAMSSRNNYLTTSDRDKSRLLSATLNDMRSAIAQGVAIVVAEKCCVKTLTNSGFIVDYVTLRETSGLAAVSKQDLAANRELIILAAVKVGKTRLIDNLIFLPGG